MVCVDRGRLAGFCSSRGCGFRCSRMAVVLSMVYGRESLGYRLRLWCMSQSLSWVLKALSGLVLEKVNVRTISLAYYSQFIRATYSRCRKLPCTIAPKRLGRDSSKHFVESYGMEP